MYRQLLLILGGAALSFSQVGCAAGKETAMPLVRIAELEIDPAQVEAYRAAVTEEIDTSVRVEPGVLVIYCVAIKDEPSKLRFFEMYADDAAYRAHIDSPLSSSTRPPPRT
jgi:quinol monooxygenase YgiN